MAAYRLLPLAVLLFSLLGCSLLPSDDDGPDLGVRDKYVSIDGIQLHYREWGAADEPPLLILHGLTGHAWEFDGLAAALSDEYHVFALNQRGHGASGWAADYSPALMAEDIAAFVDALKLGPVRIIGHSMGSANSWRLAAKYPERIERFVNVDMDPKVITSEEIVTTFMAYLDYFAQARYDDPEEAVAAYLSDYAGSHEEDLRTFVLNNIVEGDDGTWTWRFDAAGLKRWFEHASADEEGHWAAIQQIDCPTLLIRASDSPFTTAAVQQLMVESIPDARLIEISSSGHDVHIDQPDALLAQLRSFLAAHEE